MKDWDDRLLKIILILVTVCFILFISERNYKVTLNHEAEPFENSKLMVSLDIQCGECYIDHMI